MVSKRSRFPYEKFALIETKYRTLGSRISSFALAEMEQEKGRNRSEFAEMHTT